MRVLTPFPLPKLLAGLLMLSFLGAPGIVPAHAQPSPWPHEASDIAADPAVRYGALPNGMRYAIMRNSTPPGQVALRLRIAAGSLQESDAQQGLAHFLEHLAFRGSAKVPAGELQRMLERIGLRMGADTNATTGQTQTVYRFDLPNNQDQTIETGLMLMREVAGELSLAAEAMDMERGVVLSEERVRDSPAARAREAQSNFLLKGQFALERLPIGKTEVIRSAPVSELADYYRTFYRPDRATLVVTGDIDPAAVELKIVQGFSDWQAKAPDRPDPDLGMPAERGLDAEVFVEEAGPRFVSVSWATPFDGAPDTVSHRRQQLVEAIALAVVNQRLQRAAARPDPNFLSAGVSRLNMWRSARMATLSIGYEADLWREALLEAEQIRRQAVEHGVAQHEVDRELASLRSRYEAAAARASTQPTPGLANGITGALDRREVFSDAATDLRIASEQLRGLTAAEVSAALRAAFTGNGPLLFLASPTPVEDGERALAAVLEQAGTTPLAAAAAPTVTEWPYAAFGRTGAVAEQRDVPDLGTRFVRFENGVRLTIKPTRLRADEILVGLQLAGGRRSLPRDRVSAIWGANALMTGGLRDLDYLDIRRLLASKIYSANFAVGEDAYTLSGRTRPADLDVQLQVLAAYLVAPGWRAEAFQRLQTSYAMQVERGDATPAGVFNTHFGSAVRSGDRRWQQPTAEQVRAAALDELKALLAPVLAESPIEVTIVGDISIEHAIDAVAKTFGALPPRTAKAGTVPAAGEIAFPKDADAPHLLHHRGRADQGLSVIAWPTSDLYSDLQAAADRQVLNAILRMRASDELRTNSGVTYSPQVMAASSLVFPGYGYLALYAEMPPDKAGLFADTIGKLVADLRTAGPTEDELARARKPLLDGIARAAQTNTYWLDQLTGVQGDERRLDLVRFTTNRLNYVTTDRVRYAAETWLADEKDWRLMITPQTSATAGPGASAPQ